MPHVSHNVKDPEVKGRATAPGRMARGPSHAGATNSIQGKGTNLYKLLDFMKKHQPVTCQQVGNFLGVGHKDQAIKRGAQRLRGLLNDGMVSRGAQKIENSREDHALYSLTEKGNATLEVGFVRA